ncbi:uncharacterized protein [Rutidosis leptorrhynchoides]|uniref:uncharacterized protein n=1 Tax=Rutidosis leptorrhynchoides TaxID=125765 RepID=UPI003A998149
MASSSAPNQANITASINSIPMLNDTNFKAWKENFLIVLGVMDMDLVLRTDLPVDIIEASTIEDIDLMEKWERSNRMCMMIIRKAIPEVFRGSMSPDIHTAIETLAEVEARFAKNEKAEIGTIPAKLTSKKYQGKENIREHIMEIFHLAARLRALKVDLSEKLLVHLVFNSLPAQFDISR